MHGNRVPGPPWPACYAAGDAVVRLRKEEKQMPQVFRSINRTVVPAATAYGAVAHQLEDLKRNAFVKPWNFGARGRREDEPY